MNFNVRIVRTATGEVVKIVGPAHGMCDALRIERGMNINLKHDEYHTRIMDDES